MPPNGLQLTASAAAAGNGFAGLVALTLALVCGRRPSPRPQASYHPGRLRSWTIPMLGIVRAMIPPGFVKAPAPDRSRWIWSDQLGASQ